MTTNFRDASKVGHDEHLRQLLLHYCIEHCSFLNIPTPIAVRVSSRVAQHHLSQPRTAPEKRRKVEVLDETLVVELQADISLALHQMLLQRPRDLLLEHLDLAIGTSSNAVTPQRTLARPTLSVSLSSRPRVVASDASTMNQSGWLAIDAVVTGGRVPLVPPPQWVVAEGNLFCHRVLPLDMLQHLGVIQHFQLSDEDHGAIFVLMLSRGWCGQYLGRRQYVVWFQSPAASFPSAVSYWEVS